MNIRQLETPFPYDCAKIQLTFKEVKKEDPFPFFMNYFKHAIIQSYAL